MSAQLRPTDGTAPPTGASTEPIRAWRLSDIGSPEWTAAKVAELEAERAEHASELKRVIRRRETAARKAVRLTAKVAELTDRIWHLRHGAER